MRNRVGLLCLVMGLGLLNAAAPAAAANAPYGSYLQSCRAPQVKFGRDLYAFCVTGQGAWIVTRLDNFESCIGDITNQNGQLSCNQRFEGPYAAFPAAAPSEIEPAGSYRRSCNQIQYSGRILSAACRTSDGGWKAARLDLSACPPGGFDIYNVNGDLTCGGGTGPGAWQGSAAGPGQGPGPGPVTLPDAVRMAPPPPPPPPPPDPVPRGSYQASCRNARMTSGVLRADCQDRIGGWSAAIISPGGCPRGYDIANEYGRLVCRNPAALVSAAPPAGSYLTSCRDVQVYAGVLGATCTDRYGRTNASTLSLSQCSRDDDVVNEDGRLACKHNYGISRDKIPTGSYLATCRNVTMSAGFLNAECKNRSGNWERSVLGMTFCATSGDIYNQDGRLACRR